jgi:hypothetical protein
MCFRNFDPAGEERRVRAGEFIAHVDREVDGAGVGRAFVV